MAQTYRVIAGSAAARFHASKAKIKLYGGGFANGKTTALVAEALKLARDYPGSTGMLGRATYANLMKTLVREFFKWCPPGWIKTQNKNDGVVVLKNGTTIDFRYVVQQSSGEGESTSNLLSANYDWIIIDQIEDPEITEHDFQQLMGRLRGQTPYEGDDADMPRTGPRQMILSCNPSMGWLYKKMVKPLHDFRAGRQNDDLYCLRDADGNVVLDENGKKQPMIEVFEASTYDNAQNLAADYLAGLESTYSGRMRDRYILGKWVAFEGVIYDEFDSNIHVVPDAFLRKHVNSLRMMEYRLGVTEGYDFGLTEPSCYIHAFVDADDNVYCTDGFYEKGASLEWQANEIKDIRMQNNTEVDALTSLRQIWADPAIFRKTNASQQLVGISVASMFQEHGIAMGRGNNAILNGIVKVKQYLKVQKTRLNPFTHAYGAPRLYISDKLSWLIDEFEVYRWKKARDDSTVDTPVDKDDHGMDTMKYMLSMPPHRGILVPKRQVIHPKVLSWNELETPEQRRSQHRYGQ